MRFMQLHNIMQLNIRKAIAKKNQGRKNINCGRGAFYRFYVINQYLLLRYIIYIKIISSLFLSHEFNQAIYHIDIVNYIRF